MANNIFTNQLNNRELMDAFGIQQDNAPLTPEELAALSNQSEIVEPAPIIKEQKPITPIKTQSKPIEAKPQEAITEPSAIEKAMSALSNWENRTKTPEYSDSITSQTEAPMSKSEALMAEYRKMMGEDQQKLEEARRQDRMLKVGGALGDALATYLNARGQMNVKAPGVQVQQGAGLGKVADMFATSGDIASDVAQRREALLKQYAELAKGERSQARLESEEKRAKRSEDLRRELSEAENEAMLKAANIRASKTSEKKGLTPYQEVMKEEKQLQKQEKDLKALKEVETRKRTIEDNIERAKSIITDSGTFEMFGPASEELNSIIDEISVDMAKLQDPDSVARPNEVALVRKNLIPESAIGKLGMRDKTAIELLNKFKERVEERAKIGYQVRGIKAPVGEESVKPNQTQQTSNLVRIKGPSGEEATMTEENAKKYLSKKGYTRLE
jgi:hypothetical protein